MRPLRCLAVALAASAAQGAGALVQTYSSPDWYVDLTDAGYSDFLIYSAGAFPQGSIHELVSGEWAAAIGYDGIAARLTPPQTTMWLEPDWVYPDWTSNSGFTVVAPGSFPWDQDGDGLPEGSSTIGNGDVEITIVHDLVDTADGTPMGKGSGSIRSNRYVLLETYAIRNVRATSLTGVRFYPFLHGHPANDERAEVRAVYDSASYAGPFQEFRYDVTLFSTNTGDTAGLPTGCLFQDHIGFSTEVPPADFGLGPYRGHVGRPAAGLHADVENDTLGNQVAFGPDEVAGATRIDLGSIAPGATKTVRVLLSLRSDDVSPNAVATDACVRIEDTGSDPYIRLEKGICAGGAPAGPWDVVVGDLRGLDGGAGVVSLGEAQCVASDVPLDRATVLTVLSDCRRAVFLLARRGAGAQFDYGQGTGGALRVAASGDCP